MKRRAMVAGVALLGTGAAATSTRQSVLAGGDTFEINGYQLSVLRVAADWLEQSREFKPEQRRIDHYTLRLTEDELHFFVHFIPLATLGETHRLAGGETRRGKECELTIRKSDLRVEGFQFFR